MALSLTDVESVSVVPCERACEFSQEPARTLVCSKIEKQTHFYLTTKIQVSGACPTLIRIISSFYPLAFEPSTHNAEQQSARTHIDRTDFCFSWCCRAVCPSVTPSHVIKPFLPYLLALCC